MKITPDTIIAIDPDLTASGICCLNVPAKKIEVQCLNLFDLQDYLQVQRDSHIETYSGLVVVVEAGWLNKVSNYHTAASRKGQAIARKVGENHAIGKQIVAMCKKIGIEVIEKYPLRKSWKGREGKITHKEIVSLLEGSGVRYGFRQTNQEVRDSILLALNESGIVMRMKK